MGSAMTERSWRGLVLLMVCATAAISTPAVPSWGAGATLTRVSVSTDGQQPDLSTYDSSVTPDGRYVVFASNATNLVAGDLNHGFDIFLHDVVAGTTERISVNSDEMGANGNSHDPVVSDDGRYVAFSSLARNLDVRDDNSKPDVFVRDRLSGTTELVSVNNRGEIGNNGSGWGTSLDMSADGRFIVFDSASSNLTPLETTNNLRRDVFIRDRVRGVTRLMSISIKGKTGNGSSTGPSVSDDGRYVAFRSTASNLASGDDNGAADTWVRDRTTHVTELVSVSSSGVQGNADSFSNADISTNGRFVAFDTLATNLVPSDSGPDLDVLVRDLDAGTTRLVSRSDQGTADNEDSFLGCISDDGRYVEFESSSVLAPEDQNGALRDVYLWDGVDKVMQLVSARSDGVQGNNLSSSGCVSRDGRFVTFQSQSTDLVEPDANGIVGDVYLLDRTG